MQSAFWEHSLVCVVVVVVGSSGTHKCSQCGHVLYTSGW